MWSGNVDLLVKAKRQNLKKEKSNLVIFRVGASILMNLKWNSCMIFHRNFGNWSPPQNLHECRRKRGNSVARWPVIGRGRYIPISLQQPEEVFDSKIQNS